MLWRIMHEAPNLSAVPPTLRPLVEAALAKDPQARPTAPQLLSELTRGAAIPTGAHPAAGLDNPTQTILAQNWHPAVPPAGPAGYRDYPPATGGRQATGTRTRRRGAMVPVVLVLAFVLAAGGTALGLALAGRHGTSTNGTGASSPASTQPAQVVTSSAASTAPATSPASTPASTAPASTPATTPATSPASSAATSAAAVPPLTVGGYTGMKPTEIAYSGDSTNIVSKITWTSWTATGATGQGTSDINSCDPNCAQAPVKLVPATVTLSAPVNGKFTKMTETRNGFTSTYTYPDNWPEGAS